MIRYNYPRRTIPPEVFSTARLNVLLQLEIPPRLCKNEKRQCGIKNVAGRHQTGVTLHYRGTFSPACRSGKREGLTLTGEGVNFYHLLLSAFNYPTVDIHVLIDRQFGELFSLLLIAFFQTTPRSQEADLTMQLES